GLPDALGNLCALPTKEAEDKEPLRAGVLYVAAPNYHLLVERGRCFSFSMDEPVWFSRPAIDVLFESAADTYGRGLLGVLLSGANEDGAQGLARIRAQGGTTVVQTPESATARPMPDAALRLGAARHVLSPAEIGAFLAQLARGEAKGRP
ncbi:MAG TPA: chemotaxis protein CheB, partial [Polyangiaceae bacterium]|nr:chemotaxis protein CheB [Polyangiaceae bacterium]